MPSIRIPGQSDRGVHQRPGAIERMPDTACTRLVGGHLLDGARHRARQEQAARVTDVLLDFLQGHATSPALAQVRRSG